MPMTRIERQAVFSISSIFSLRMLGIFMILPIFSPYAHTLKGTTPLLVGVALGIYGLTQAFLQFPLGALSDYYARKKIIAIGLMIFILGSLLSSFAESIYMMIIGRALQGAGAVGSTLIALLTDLLRPEQRSKAMAIMGISIGLSFFLSMIISPVLAHYFSVQNIFKLSSFLGLCAIIILFSIVPEPENVIKSKAIFSRQLLVSIFKNGQLTLLNISVFFLHAILTANFLVIPLLVIRWQNYILPILSAVILTFLTIGYAEKNKKVFLLFFCAITGLVISELLLWLHFSISFSVGLFFLSFNILEANLPSLISRLAPTAIRGQAIGIYSTCQFLGIFCGGLCGGWINQYFSAKNILLCGSITSIIWLIFTLIIRLRRKTSWQKV